jgi:hypothetical protein
MVTEKERQRLLYGSVEEAYSTGMFGTTETRSESAAEKLDRLAELNAAELERGLGPNEVTERDQLRAAMPTSAPVRSLKSA